jgi:hypothetical protein
MNIDAHRFVATVICLWHVRCLFDVERSGTSSSVKRIDMDTYSPELSQWLLGMADEHASDTGSKRRTDELAELQQEAALEELAERINAARSVV